MKVRTNISTLGITVLGLGVSAHAASTLPQSLVGSWLYGSISNIQYMDVNTQKWMDTSGATEIVTYHADGRYERTRLLSMTTYSCTSKLFITEKGTVKLSGKRITYQPTEGVNQGYTCSPGNGWRTTKINSETWTYSFEKNSNGQDVLVLKNDKEAVAHYGRYQKP